MASLLLYILKSTICLILFYVGFKALLSNETFFRFNRWVLLGGVIVCLLLPFVRLHTSETMLIQRPMMHLEQIISGDDLLPENQEASEVAGVNRNVQELTVKSDVKVDWGLVISVVYLLGGISCLVVTITSFRKMYFIIRSGRKVKQGKYTLILIPSAIAPFSWRRYIILSEDDYKQYPDEILSHERMHLQSHHSLDLLFMEIIILLHWFNPAIWLLKRELKEIHEFEADNGVLEQGIDATKYQLLLVKKAVGSSHYTLANSFNHSKIKKRITMMLKGKSNNWARLKLLLLVPVGLIALNAFARPEINRQLETLVESKDNATRPDIQQSDPQKTQQNYNDFFREQLRLYMNKGDKNVTFTPDEIVAFLDKNTNKQNLFINSFGEVLLNTKRVSFEQLPAKLQEIFSSSGNNGKPVSFYSLLDRGSPEKSVEIIFGLVKEAFQNQQAKVGVDKAPFLLFQDTGNNKNFSKEQMGKKHDVAFYTFDGKKVTPVKYEELKKNFKRMAFVKSELSGAQGKIVEIHTHNQLEDGSTIPSPAVYAELSESSEAENFPVYISYRIETDDPEAIECIMSCNVPDRIDKIKSEAQRLSKQKDKVDKLSVRPAKKGVPLSHLEMIKKIMEEYGLSCTIVNEVPAKAK